MDVGCWRVAAATEPFGNSRRPSATTLTERQSNQPTNVEVDQVNINPTPISAPKSQSHTHRQHGCPLRSSSPVRDHGMLRHSALCDREDPMLTRSCSLPYALPRLPNIPPMRCYQDTKIYSYSSSALPVLVSPRSGTFRTAARGPGTRWTSGTDRVRDLPIALEEQRGEIQTFVENAAEDLRDREGREKHMADIYLQ